MKNYNAVAAIKKVWCSLIISAEKLMSAANWVLL